MGSRGCFEWRFSAVHLLPARISAMLELQSQRAKRFEIALSCALLACSQRCSQLAEINLLGPQPSLVNDVGLGLQGISCQLASHPSLSVAAPLADFYVPPPLFTCIQNTSPVAPWQLQSLHGDDAPSRMRRRALPAALPETVLQQLQT